MTIESTTTKKVHEGNGTATVFPVPFKYSRPEDIRLIFTDARGVETEITSNFRVAIDNSGDASVIYPVAGEPIPFGSKFTIYRKTPQTQIVGLTYGGDWNPKILEKDGFDRSVMMIQELREEVSRAVKLSISDERDPPTAEDFYRGVQNIADEAQQWAGVAKEQADRAQLLTSEAELSSQVFNARESWVLEEDIPEGGTLTLPIAYYPMRNTLLLNYRGIPCTPKTARSAMHGRYQYEEVGDDANTASFAVVLAFAASAGDVFDAMSLSTGMSTAEFEQFVSRASDAAALAENASTDAIDAAGRAEAAAAGFPDLGAARPGQVATAQTVDGEPIALWADPPGGTRAKQSITLEAELPAGSMFIVPPYMVGAGKLDIYLAGVLCEPGTDLENGFYSETGAAGEISDTITIFDAIPAGWKITAIAAS